MTGEHASNGLVAAYVAGDRALPDKAVWALEAHLETCSACRQLVADAVPGLAPQVDTQLARVWS